VLKKYVFSFIIQQLVILFPSKKKLDYRPLPGVKE
jgi:hypothetical protein